MAKKSLDIEIVEVKQSSAPQLKLYLILGISKGDRMDYALQKSTELGVTHITPIWTERGDVKLKAERLEKKILHWQGVITSACEQSYQNYVPELLEPQQLADVTVDSENLESGQELALVCDVSGEPLAAFAAMQPKCVTFFVGPEGGWTPEEIESLRTKNVKALQLGPRILRTETAPVAMLSLAQYLWGDF
jgi:16S rRNA (uracil1498-N3)-methyltransferase